MVESIGILVRINPAKKRKCLSIRGYIIALNDASRLRHYSKQLSLYKNHFGHVVIFLIIDFIFLKLIIFNKQIT